MRRWLRRALQLLQAALPMSTHDAPKQSLSPNYPAEPETSRPALSAPSEITDQHIHTLHYEPFDIDYNDPQDPERFIKRNWDTLFNAARGALSDQHIGHVPTELTAYAELLGLVLWACQDVPEPQPISTLVAPIETHDLHAYRELNTLWTLAWTLRHQPVTLACSELEQHIQRWLNTFAQTGSLFPIQHLPIYLAFDPRFEFPDLEMFLEILYVRLCLLRPATILTCTCPPRWSPLETPTHQDHVRTLSTAYRHLRHALNEPFDWSPLFAARAGLKRPPSLNKRVPREVTLPDLPSSTIQCRRLLVTASNLLGTAIRVRTYTISPLAEIIFPQGPIRRVLFSEVPGHACMALVTLSNSTALTAYFEYDNPIQLFLIPGFSDAPEWYLPLLSCVTAACSAAFYDLVVVGDLATDYHIHNVTRSQRLDEQAHLPGGAPDATSVYYQYLPRFRCANRITVPRRKALRTVIPHLVVGHPLRLSMGRHPSPAALARASLYGVHLKPTETFRKPHQRGADTPSPPRARSRSALRLLYEHDPRSSSLPAS